MRTPITEFISLDGVVQAPGAPTEDTDGGFAHGGWMARYFDPEVIGGTFDQLAKQSDALLQGRRTYQVSPTAWPSRCSWTCHPRGYGGVGPSPRQTLAARDPPGEWRRPGRRGRR